MKKDIQPIYYSDAKIICACGNNFNIGSTTKEIHVEICSKCHPFYTGKQKLIDTARRVDRFKARLAKKETIDKKTKKQKNTKTIKQKNTRTDKSINNQQSTINNKKNNKIKKTNPPADGVKKIKEK